MALVGAVVLFTGERLERGLAGALAAAGFRLTSLQVAGASPDAARDIAAATGLRRGDPLLAVDLAALRARVEAVGWVEEARVSRMLPGALVIQVTERTPVAVWNLGGRLTVIDGEGKPIPEASPARFATLPLIVGAGANRADPEIYELVRSRPRLAQRLEALVRIDERRWDLRLKNGALVLLPATGVDSALIRLDQLDQAQRVLDLGFERIDLRSPDMVVVRRAGDSPIPPPPVGSV